MERVDSAMMYDIKEEIVINHGDEDNFVQIKRMKGPDEMKNLAVYFHHGVDNDPEYTVIRDMSFRYGLGKIVFTDVDKHAFEIHYKKGKKIRYSSKYNDDYTRHEFVTELIQ